MNEKLSKCSFCGKKAPILKRLLKRPKGWLIFDMSGFGYTNLQACEQCARFIMVNRLLSQIGMSHTRIDLSFLQPYFPDFKKLEDIDK